MPTKREAVWVVNARARIEALGNEQLLEETIDAAMGDDYDGCFTKHGEVEFTMLKTELRKRLEPLGWYNS